MVYFSPKNIIEALKTQEYFIILQPQSYAQVKDRIRWRDNEIGGYPNIDGKEKWYSTSLANWYKKKISFKHITHKFCARLHGNEIFIVIFFLFVCESIRAGINVFS